MSIEIIISIVIILGALLTAGVTLMKKHPIVWLVALVCVNSIEFVCKWLQLKGYGDEKYKFVYQVISILQGTYQVPEEGEPNLIKKILLKLNPKLTDEEIRILIESIVSKMHVMQGEEG